MTTATIHKAERLLAEGKVEPLFGPDRYTSSEGPIRLYLAFGQ